MTLKSHLAAGMVAAVLLGSCLAALAQDAPVTPPAAPPATAAADPASATTAGGVTPAKPEDNWRKICSPIDETRRACVMQQVIQTRNNVFVGAFTLRDDPGQASRLTAVAAVPLGVMLPFGMTLQIDGGKPVRLPYVSCDPVTCFTTLVINENYVNSLKKGTKLTLTAKNRKNQDLVVEINLAGFTAVYDGEAALTVDQANGADGATTALEKILQDRAEELRKQLDAPADPNAPAPQ